MKKHIILKLVELSHGLGFTKEEEVWIKLYDYFKHTRLSSSNFNYFRNVPLLFTGNYFMLIFKVVPISKPTNIPRFLFFIIG